MKYLMIGVSVIALTACSSLQQPKQLGLASGMHLAQAAEESGDVELATNVYASASESAPRDAAVQLKYADALVRQNKLGEALEVLQKHLNTVSDARPLHGALGLIYLVQGQAAQAFAEFDAMGNTNENRWLVNKAIALDMLNRHTDAQALYRKALVNNPANTAITSNLAMSLLLSGNKTEAMKLAASLANDPSPRVRATFGVVQAANGNIAAARAALPGLDDARLMQLAKAIPASGGV